MNIFRSPFALLAAAGLGLFVFPTGRSAELREAPELAAAFVEAGLSGTFAMRDPRDGSIRVHDAERARTRFIPASTFKIPNSLIGLDCGAVKDVDEVFPYDGTPQPYDAWEKAMSLREAIPVSNVPVYQELARRIGRERMREGLRKLDYGNQETGEVIDRFWLDGPLEISALEQVEFLRRLAAGDLPVSPEAIAAVQEITLLEKSPTFALHGKTGWTGVGTAAKPGTGWFVGWVERDGEVYPFALNIVATNDDEIPKRVPLARECLRRLGVLDDAGKGPSGD